MSEKTSGIERYPHFNDPTFLQPENSVTWEIDHLPGGRSASQFAGLRANQYPTSGDQFAFAENVLDVETNVRKGLADRCDVTLNGLKAAEVPEGIVKLNLGSENCVRDRHIGKSLEVRSDRSLVLMDCQSRIPLHLSQLGGC